MSRYSYLTKIKSLKKEIDSFYMSSFEYDTHLFSRKKNDPDIHRDVDGDLRFELINFYFQD